MELSEAIKLAKGYLAAFKMGNPKTHLAKLMSQHIRTMNSQPDSWSLLSAYNGTIARDKDYQKQGKE